MTEFIKPMLANAIDWEKVSTLAARGYVMEPKIDGIRCIVSKQGNEVGMYTRTGHTLHDKLPHLREQFKALPIDFTIDGEVGYILRDTVLGPIIDFNATTRVTGSGVEEALRKQDENWEEDPDKGIFFYAFDILGLQGITLQTTSDRLRRVALCEAFIRDGGAGWGYFDIIQRCDVWLEGEYIQYVEEGGEGMMLKNPQANYISGKRPANRWYKVKKFDTLDVVIADDYLPGQGKYEGQVGALRFGLYDSTGELVVFSKCSGMDDAFRRELTDHFYYYRHKVMEIRYFGKVGADGSGLRHPQFLRMRPDKDPKECILYG